MALLCLCCRWPQDPDTRRAVADAAAHPVDWTLIQRLARRHRVEGLVSYALLQSGAPLPDATRAWCLERRQAVDIMEMKSAAEARSLVAALRAAGIDPLVFKGPAISILAYGRLGLRTNRDIDLLVTPGEVAAATAVLQALGYTRIEPVADAPADAVERWLRNRKDMVFAKAGAMLVELHWRLFDNPALLAGREGGARQTVTQGPFAFDTLGPDDNLLYLCVHGAQHAWSRLKWLADVAALLRAASTDEIERLVLQARKAGVYPSVGQALLLATHYLGLELPEHLHAELRRGPVMGWITRVAERSLFAGDGLELEQLRFGSTLKNISHYGIATGWAYRRNELRFDLLDLDAAGLPEHYRWLGPFARPLASILRRFSRLQKMQSGD